ncbi:uncharacterized protein YutE (UPF0331/DUF86 family) [Hydrogenispora ethanolica]|uniref:Uncharacterized protein YutE (UPF0331/DUF86 family) n=1 Tax=Hydrogenispora ethanolica TaxID=1082276 RepID=A0A4R1RQ02_HYDET|nr:DUF86 domain-containing protein [Hydrogenispora ethanolica]TCL68463.1 uncharacterized protein YutE (UPF0331/DUF86 family) [Hydrogenispora ethanolica]
MVDSNLLKNKLAQLADYLADLQDSQTVSLDLYRNDKKTRRYIERTLHLAIECCLDIGSHIIADNGWREPVDNKDVFAVLAENGVFSQELVPRLQKMAQFRNVLVHDYAKIDPDIVYRVLTQNLPDIREFIRAVERLL